jgi:hypothetical protein
LINSLFQCKEGTHLHFAQEGIWFSHPRGASTLWRVPIQQQEGNSIGALLAHFCLLPHAVHQFSWKPGASQRHRNQHPHVIQPALSRLTLNVRKKLTWFKHRDRVE